MICDRNETSLSNTILLIVIVFLYVIPNAIEAQDDRIFVERFAGKPEPRWDVKSSPDSPGLRWHKRDEKPGFYFRSAAIPRYVRNREYAYAEWEIGTEAFEFSFDVELKQGQKQEGFYPGVAVALSSAPPGKMKRKDIAISFGVHMEGPAAAVRQGGFYNFPGEKGSKEYSRIGDTILSNLIERRKGKISSVSWPMSHLENTRLTLKIGRSKKNHLKFTITHHGLPGDRGGPYWTGSWRMPEEIAAIPLRYVCIKRMPVTSDHLSYSSFVMEGRVNNIQGRSLSVAPPPVPGNISSERPVLSGGAKVTISGQNFHEGCRVEIGGKPAQDVKTVSSLKLLARLPELPLKQRHALWIINPNGLSGNLEDGVPYGRLLEEVRPREAIPKGGSVVTMIGAGFEENTSFLFGRGKTGSVPAENVKIIDPLHARVTVPPGQKGRCPVRAKTGDKEFEGRLLFGYAPHPYIFFQKKDLAGLREKFRAPMFKKYRSIILKTADDICRKHPEEKGGPATGPISILSWAYLLAEEEKYEESLLEWLQQGWLSTEYEDFGFAGTVAIATAYDILFRQLSPEQRAMCIDYLDRMLEGYLRMARANSWLLGGTYNVSNTVAVNNCGGMLAGLALIYSTREAEKAVNKAAELDKFYIENCFSQDGGCVEGSLYWDYGGTFHLILAHALKNVTGNARGLLDHPHLRKNINFVKTQIGGHKKMFAFNASQPWLTGMAICADLGSRYNQPLMLWLADYMASGGPSVNVRSTFLPYAFLWRNRTASPETFPGVPKIAYLKNMHWGVMRSDTSFMPGLVVGIKGSEGILTHHKQRDSGSFVLQARGEPYLIDPGYYHPRPTDHTLPLVDGKGPKARGSKIVNASAKGPWQQMTVDSTKAYAKAAQRVRRTIVMHENDAVIVLDDILAAEGKPGEITTHFQCGRETELKKDRRSALISGKNGKVLLHCFGPSTRLSIRPRSFNNSWVWANLAKTEGAAWQTVSGTYRASETLPLITVLLPLGQNEKPPVPQWDCKENEILIYPGMDFEVTFAQKDGLWEFASPEAAEPSADRDAEKAE
ncbi:MAG: IPT/TIG domain-containing protein [Candidatus Brocadiia bacterium]